MGWGGGTPGLALTKGKLSPGKKYFFCIEKYVEDVKQKQKDVPDLVESIIRPTRLAKEELRRILMKTMQFRHKILEHRLCNF